MAAASLDHAGACTPSLSPLTSWERGAAQSAIEIQAAEMEARIERQAHTVADIDARVSQLDAAISEGTKRGQFAAFVLGVETDFDITSIEKTTNGVTTKLPWFGTTRGRLAFLVNPALLLYGTGGVAYGRAEVSVPGASVKIPGVGWAAGAGVQDALTPQWSIGAEYLHVELDGPSASAGGVSIDTKATTDLGRATLNYKF